jgi:LacI family transcriptional regulator
VPVMPTGTPRPTLADVARLAGVSLKTASRVLNGEPHVSDATAAKVQTAADQLGFRPNVIARELRQGARASTVGLVIGDVANPFYARVARGVERRLRTAGLQLVTASSDEDPDTERALTAEMLERRVRALLLVTCLPDHSHLERERTLGVPVVFLDRPPTGLVADAVAIDNEGGAAQAAMALMAQGHVRIGLVGDLTRLPTHRERVRGFADVLISGGIDHWERLLRADLHDAEAAHRAVHELLLLPSPPTALFTTNNRITVGALRALTDHTERGGTPPALVGFDDFDLADVLGVTVVAHSPEDMGRLGAEVLLERLAGSESPTRTVRLPTRLIPRGSGERAPA